LWIRLKCGRPSKNNKMSSDTRSVPDLKKSLFPINTHNLEERRVSWVSNSALHKRLSGSAQSAGMNGSSRCTDSEAQHIGNIPSRQRLWSSTTDSLSVSAVRLSTVGRRAFPVLVLVYRTIYLRTLSPHRLRLHLSND